MMYSYLEVKYINILSSKLEQFSWKKNNLANCRCPICGDSTKSKTKKRFYIFEFKGSYVVKCHNCGYSDSFVAFLKEYDNNLYKMYLYDKISDSKPQIEKPKTYTHEAPQFDDSGVLENTVSISSLDDDHPAKKYIVSRKIPEKYHRELYYTDDFANVAKKLDDTIELPAKEPRIIIPFRNKQNQIFAIQGRSVGHSNLKYITIKKKNLDTHKIYGMNTVDFSKKFYIVEGPIDSMFLDNAIAMAGADLGEVFDDEEKNNAVIIYDNEPRNKEIVKKIRFAIEKGYNVCIWPTSLEEKDINDMILSGFDAQGIIDSNTHRGLTARLKFYNWKRCEETNDSIRKYRR